MSQLTIFLGVTSTKKAAWQHIIYLFAVNMQYFNETNIISKARISDCPGGNLLRHSACPQQIQPVGGKWAIAYF